MSGLNSMNDPSHPKRKPLAEVWICVLLVLTLVEESVLFPVRNDATMPRKRAHCFPNVENSQVRDSECRKLP